MSETPIAGSAQPAVVRRADVDSGAPRVPQGAQRASRHRAAERQRVLLAAARHRSFAEHQRLPRRGRRRRRARRLGRPLPPRDRRAGLASLRIHVRPFRRRRADRARAAVRVEPGRNAGRGVAFRASPRNPSATASAPPSRSASLSSASASPSDELLARTERVLHVAKQFGRDRVEVASTPPSRIERAKVVGLHG